MSTRKGMVVEIDAGAAGREDFLASVGHSQVPASEAALHLHLLRAGALRAQVLPLPVSEARLRLATWSRGTLTTLAAPLREGRSWRDALHEAFMLEGNELFAMANERLIPLSVIAMQLERPFDTTFVRPAAVWDVIEPWLSERFPATALLQYGRRLSALVPGVGVADLPVVAEELRLAVEAARTARVVDASVAIGIAAFPDDARDLGPLLRLAEGAALRSSALNATMVVRGTPSLLLVGNKLPVQLEGSSLLQRLDIKVLRASEDDAIGMLAREHPTAAVVSLHASHRFLDALGSMLARGVVPHTRFILVSPKDESTREHWGRHPQATVLLGKDRLGGRTLEEIALSLGLKPRRHLRTGKELPVEVDSGSRTVRGLLLNVSESGARIVVEVPRLDEALGLRLFLPGGRVSTAARVAWQREKGSECEAGLRFEALSDEARRIIGAFVGGASEPEPDLPRAAPRFAIERKLKLKLRVRPRGSTGSHYLSLVNLAEGGCLSTGLAIGALEVGAVADLHFFGASGAFSCVGEVVRRSDSPRPEYAWRFVELDRQAFSDLRRLLSTFDQGGPRRRLAAPVTRATTRSSPRST